MLANYADYGGLIWLLAAMTVSPPTNAGECSPHSVKKCYRANEEVIPEMVLIG